MEIIRTILKARAAAAVDSCPEMVGKPYRPSTGTEGAAFDEAWCANCERDKAYRDGGPDADPAIACRIIADTFVYAVSDPRYPKEWVYDRDGCPSCTAYTEDPKCPVRCDKTIDMFENREPHSSSPP